MATLEKAPHRFTALESVKIPRVMRTIFILLLSGFLITLIFLIYVPWVQTTTGRGMVTTLSPNDREQTINALVTGRIEQWYVRDGAMVRQGDPIVRIADIDPQLIERLEAEVRQVELQLEASRSALSTAQIDERRMRELFEAGLAPRREYEQAMIRIQDMRGRIASEEAALARTRTNLSRQAVQVVTAPRDGFIQRVQAGDAATFVSAGDMLAMFVPESTERVVEVFIVGRDVALVQKGAKARIMFEGWPAVQFSGWPAVAVGTFGGIVIAVDQSAQPDGRFRVLIREDMSDPHRWPEERFVRFGAKAQAWVLLDTVPVGYEIWRQLNSFPPELPGAAATTTGD
jgi:multidrug resistance efflux pump